MGLSDVPMCLTLLILPTVFFVQSFLRSSNAISYFWWFLLFVLYLTFVWYKIVIVKYNIGLIVYLVLMHFIMTKLSFSCLWPGWNLIRCGWHEPIFQSEWMYISEQDCIRNHRGCLLAHIVNIVVYEIVCITEHKSEPSKQRHSLLW